jgi:hypothetical protein
VRRQFQFALLCSVSGHRIAPHPVSILLSHCPERVVADAPVAAFLIVLLAMASSNPDLDRAFAEVDAMRVVANALGSLRDDSRLRVLEWARHHFATSAAAAGTLRLKDGADSAISAMSAAPRSADFSALTVGDDLFEPEHPDVPRPPVPFVPVDHGPHSRAESWRRPAASRFKLESQFRDIRRAFRRFAHKWQRAS